jgi:hypothetical protein
MSGSAEFGDRGRTYDPLGPILISDVRPAQTGFRPRNGVLTNWESGKKPVSVNRQVLSSTGPHMTRSPDFTGHVEDFVFRPSQRKWQIRWVDNREVIGSHVQEDVAIDLLLESRHLTRVSLYESITIQAALHCREESSLLLG